MGLLVSSLILQHKHWWSVFSRLILTFEAEIVGFFSFFIPNMILGMSCDVHYRQLFAPIVVLRERYVSNVIIHYTACSSRRIIIFLNILQGLKLKAQQIPKRIKLFCQQLFLKMVISSFGIHRQLPDPLCSVVCSNQPRKDQWRSYRTLCSLCGSDKQTKWLYFLKTQRLK